VTLAPRDADPKKRRGKGGEKGGSRSLRAETRTSPPVHPFVVGAYEEGGGVQATVAPAPTSIRGRCGGGRSKRKKEEGGKERSMLLAPR